MNNHDPNTSRADRDALDELGLTPRDRNASGDDAERVETAMPS